MVTEAKVICVGCPLGCGILLTIGERKEVTKASGNKCKEGRAYAIKEHENPVRVLTATVLTQDSSKPLLPVRTDKPISKTSLRESMRVLAKVRAKPPLRAGDVLVTNLLDTGANVVSTSHLHS